jgi:glutamyl-tRNA reductase
LELAGHVTTSADGIVALIAHARDVPAIERQRFRERLDAERAGGFLFETCHRVEVYATLDGTTEHIAATLPSAGRALRGEAAVRHVVAVAAGRDSVVVGEDQVLHQLRQALEGARAAGTLEPIIGRLMTTALRAGRRARSWYQGRPRSLADVAVDRIEEEAGALADRAVLIVGAGRMGQLAARAVVAKGARVAVSSRSADHAEELAAAVGGRADDFDPGDRAARFAGIVVALAGPWHVGADGIDALRLGSTVVVDISDPPAVAPGLATVLGRRLTTADDLARATAGGPAVPDRVIARLDELIDGATAEFLAWLDGHERRAAAHALVARADREREAELAELWRRLPDLDPQARATIEGMARHLGERLLREPLERLGSDADGRHERAVRELWAL